jgi:Mor family transcriptional regulator
MSGGPIYRRDGDASPTLGGLTALLGAEALARLSKRFGGRRIYVPATINPGHELAVVLGLEPALVLAKHFAGLTLSVPMPQHAADRRRQVIEMNAEGFTRAAIAEKVGLTERRVYQILDEDDDSAPRPQLKLF